VAATLTRQGTAIEVGSQAIDIADLQRIFDALPGNFLVVANDSDFTMVAVSQERLHATLTRREEVIGRPLFEVYCGGAVSPSGVAGANLLQPSLAEAARSRTVWTLGLVHTATFGLAVLVGIWITTFLVHDFGLSLVSAGAAGSAILALGVISRPLGGWLIDRGVVSARLVMRLTVLGGAIGLAVLAWPGRPLTVAALAICALGVAFNAPYAAVMNTTGAVLPRAPGAAVGLVSGLGVIAIAVGAPVVGALFGSTGSFTAPFAALAAFSLVVFWALFSL